MDFGKPGSSDSSGDDYDPQEHVKYDPTKRPYECTFCKRGFTNAQALGGHMNIHRKDRAKAKQRLNSSSSHSNEQSESGCRYFPPVSGQPTAAYYPAENHAAAHRSNYRTYFEPNAAANYPIHRPGSPSLSVNEELLGVNLSLQIEQTRSVWKTEELDLELRLGHEYR